MSADGGSQEEFEEYWSRNAAPLRLTGGWVERRSHPQVNVEPFWYHEASSSLSFEPPPGAVELEPQPEAEECVELAGEGPEWEMSVRALKVALAEKRGKALGLRTEELARRAVSEYERFEPRVLSWHDYQNITFWFFGGLQRRQQRGAGSKSFFSGKSGYGSDLFADSAFFHAAADLIEERIDQMHPINLTYFVWTFTRAGVVLPKMMEAVGNHLCKGLLPTLDRCSLGTMVWNFSKQGVRHDRLFEDAAQELSRPNRCRSLAARNFQNVTIAYTRPGHWHQGLFTALANGIPRLLDPHDPSQNKNERSVLFSYTCKDGSEVLADSFRIGNLTVILKGFLRMRRFNGPAIERCLESMADYVRRSQKVTSSMMREQGDTEEFVLTVARAAADGRWNAAAVLSENFDLAQVLSGLPEQKADQLRRSLRRAGLAADL